MSFETRTSCGMTVLEVDLVRQEVVGAELAIGLGELGDEAPEVAVGELVGQRRSERRGRRSAPSRSGTARGWRQTAGASGVSSCVKQSPCPRFSPAPVRLSTLQVAPAVLSHHPYRHERARAVGAGTGGHRNQKLAARDRRQRQIDLVGTSRRPAVARSGSSARSLPHWLMMRAETVAVDAAVPWTSNRMTRRSVRSNSRPGNGRAFGPRSRLRNSRAFCARKSAGDVIHSAAAAGSGTSIVRTSRSMISFGAVLDGERHLQWPRGRRKRCARRRRPAPRRRGSRRAIATAVTCAGLADPGRHEARAAAHDSRRSGARCRAPCPTQKSTVRRAFVPRQLRQRADDVRRKLGFGRLDRARSISATLGAQ